VPVTEPRGGDVESAALGLPADWPEAVKLRLWVVEEDGSFQALCENFTIVGMGETPQAAIRNVVEMLDDYIRCHLADGASWADVHRPAPLRMRLKLWVRYIASRVLRRLRDVQLETDAGRLDAQGLHLAHG